MPSETIKKILKEKSVWEKSAELFRARRKQYILPEDEKALAALKRICPALSANIHFDLFPKTIIYNRECIDVPVFMSLINVGYSHVDVYHL